MIGAMTREDSTLPLEILAVWVVLAVVAVEILVTYWRLAPSELYHVSGSGLEGGASRALVFSNFPTALVAIAVLALLWDRLRGTAADAAVVGVALCAAVFWPGVVDQADLDARPVNVVAAVGVLVAAVLSALVRRRGTRIERWHPSDRARVVVAAAALFIGLPWIAAELGFFLDGVPVLGTIFRTERWSSGDQIMPPPVVHHGHHHGMDGVLLVLSALLLSRVVPSVRRSRLRVAIGAYLSLMLAYGAANIANDFWTEQAVKRGWTRWLFPDVLRPSLTIAWGLIVLAAALIYAAARAGNGMKPREKPSSR